jgi:hypothetical protein
MAIGALLMLAPFFGLLGTVFGMTRAFGALGSSGIADPQALSASIGTTLVSAAAGFALFPVGFIVLALSLAFFLHLRVPTPPPLPRAAEDEQRPLP